jgi:LysM repeat protein
VEEDEPMPNGAFLPQQKQEAVAAETAEPANTTEAVPEIVEEVVTVPEEKSEPEIIEPVVPVQPEKAQPEKAQPEKGGSPAAAVKERKNDVEYTVKKGDSYWKIAKNFGISTAALVAYNEIPPEKLRPGQKIMIPATGKKVTAKAPAANAKVSVKKTYAPIPANGIYVVQKGDSFYKIAMKFGLRAKDIADYNNLPLTKMLQVNQKLKLPAKGAAKPVEAPAKTEPAAPAVPAETPAVPAEASGLGEVAEPVLDTEVPAVPVNTAAPVLDEVPESPEMSKAKAALEEDKKIAADEMICNEATTVQELSQSLGITEEDLRKKNPGLPADGKIVIGTTIKL